MWVLGIYFVPYVASVYSRYVSRFVMIFIFNHRDFPQMSDDPWLPVVILERDANTLTGSYREDDWV